MPHVVLGLRLATSVRSNWVALAIAASGVALATSLLLLALGVAPALRDRDARARWRAGGEPAADAAHHADAARWLPSIEFFRRTRIERIDVAALGADVPVPPGLSRVPAAGEAYASPALADLLDRTPDDELGARYGEVVGTIGADGLRDPGELLVVVGRPAAELAGRGATESTTVDFAPQPRSLSDIYRILLWLGAAAVLAPVGIFIGTATRLSAARREQRLATLRLLGATPLQVRRLAAVEAVAAALPGIVVGCVLFAALRPLAARVTVDGAAFYPADVTPSLVQIIGLVAAVLVVAAVASQVALRRLVISPLGVSRRSTTRPPTPLRLVPLFVSLPLFAVTILTTRYWAGATPAYLIIGSFVLVMGAIVVAGPWLTLVVGRVLGRIGGPASLLAGRRLRAAAGTGFRTVAAVVLAVFAGAFFDTIATTAAGLQPDSALAAPTFVATSELPAAELAAAADELATVEGVEDTLPLPGAVVYTESERYFARAWVAPCSDVARLFPGSGLDCRTGIQVSSERVPDSWARVSAGSDPTSEGPVDGNAGLVSPSEASEFDAGRARARGLTAEMIVDPSLLPAGPAIASDGRLAIRTDGDPHSLERARTALVLAGFRGQTEAETRVTNNAVIAEIRHLINLGLLATLLLAGCSAAIAVSASVLERRWPFALLRLAGTPLGTLRRVVVLEALAPLLVAAVMSLAIGAATAQMVMQIVNGSSVAAPLGLAVPLAIGLVLATVLVLGTLPLLGRVTTTEATRFD
jgi:hypothetical protein